MFEILTLGEKLKRIRKQLHITQEELACVELKRNYIAKLEWEKTKIHLTNEKAEILVKRISEIQIENNIKLEINITAEYLLESLINQITRIIKDIEKNMSLWEMNKFNYKDFKIFLEEVDKFFIEVRSITNNINAKKENKDMERNKSLYLYKHVDLYKRISMLLKENYNYIDAEIYLIKATSEATVYEKYDLAMEFILERIRLYKKRNLPEEELMLTKYAMDYYKIHDLKNESNLKSIYFNRAVAFSKLGLFSKCIKYLDILTNGKYEFSQDDMLDIKIVHSNNYFRCKNYRKAETLYLEIVDIAIENKREDIIAMTYRSLEELYIETNEIEKAIFYLEKAASLENIEKYTSRIEVYFSQLKLNVLCKRELPNVPRIFKELIASCNLAKEYEIKSEAYKYICIYYINCRKDTELDKIIKTIREDILRKRLFLNEHIYSALIATLEYFRYNNINLFEEVLTILTSLNGKHTTKNNTEKI